MSTQSPHPPTPKGSRNNNTPNNNNNRRTAKKNNTPQAPKTALINTPPSSPPRNMSPTRVATDSSNNVQSKKKPPRSGKKPNNMNGASPAPNNGYRHNSSNSHSTTPQTKDSAAYAGPTFHASPAPSALPIQASFPSHFQNLILRQLSRPTVIMQRWNLTWRQLPPNDALVLNRRTKRRSPHLLISCSRLQLRRGILIP